jgi:hypothetical protein
MVGLLGLLDATQKRYGCASSNCMAYTCTPEMTRTDMNFSHPFIHYLKHHSHRTCRQSFFSQMIQHLLSYIPSFGRKLSRLFAERRR